MLSEQEFNKRLQKLDEKEKKFIEKYSMSYNLQNKKKTPACNLNSSDFYAMCNFFGFSTDENYDLICFVYNLGYERGKAAVKRQLRNL